MQTITRMWMIYSRSAFTARPNRPFGRSSSIRNSTIKCYGTCHSVGIFHIPRLSHQAEQQTAGDGAAQRADAADDDRDEGDKHSKKAHVGWPRP